MYKRQEHGEVFTPDWLVNDMLNLVAHEAARIDSRFLEPACGEGAFLAPIPVSYTHLDVYKRQRW